ncbi:hypothetical protein J6590_020454 [Homalodisca vitripennis]|nr:hypothetical protein J6590_020454 [Homalodisca vitripennis]
MRVIPSDENQNNMVAVIRLFNLAHCCTLRRCCKHTSKMSGKGASKQDAYNYVESSGRSVAQNPGGYASMGFHKVGPQRDTIAGKAQSYQGNVSKGSTFAEMQHGSMKKK